MDDIEIYTGYYANIRKYMAGGCALVGISVGTPSYLKGNTLITWRRTLAPTYPMIRIEDMAEYTRQYRAHILGRLDARVEISAVQQIARSQGRKRAVLMCYEKPPKFCHRSLVAEWMNATGEVCVREYGYEGVSAAKPHVKAVTGDLFEAFGVEMPKCAASEDAHDWR